MNHERNVSFRISRLGRAIAVVVGTMATFAFSQASLAASPTGDELMLRRLKKRKLALKDRIIAIEHMLSPDERA